MRRKFVFGPGPNKAEIPPGTIFPSGQTLGSLFTGLYKPVIPAVFLDFRTLYLCGFHCGWKPFWGHPDRSILSYPQFWGLRGFPGPSHAPEFGNCDHVWYGNARGGFSSVMSNKVHSFCMWDQLVAPWSLRLRRILRQNPHRHSIVERHACCNLLFSVWIYP